MAGFAITSVTTSKPDYNVGDEIELTVEGTLAQAATVTVSLADGSSGTAGFGVFCPLAVSDTGSRDWAPVSNDGATAVFTATA